MTQPESLMTANTDPGWEITVAQEKADLADPHDCTDAKDVLSILHAAYDTLVSVDNGQITPGLAKEWSVSADARHWRFQLRDGVRFHDGTACTADAVAQSLRRMSRADKGYTLGAPGVWSQYMGDAQIECDGERALAVTLPAPLADFPDILAQGFIAAPSMIDQMDAGAAPLPCGTGPYRILSAQPGHISAVRIDGHFRATAGPGTVHWVGEPDPEARQHLLLSGRVQVANHLPFMPAEGETHPDVTYIRYQNPVAIIYLLNAARGPFADPAVRAALNLAIDREVVVQRVLQGAAQPLHGVMTPVALGADRLRETVPDPLAARKLLANAGHGEGLTLRVDCPTRLPDEAEALTAELGRQLKPLGVSLEITLHRDREAYAHMVRRKEIGDLCVFDSSPLSTFRVLHEKIDSRVRGTWWQGYANERIEAELDQARSVTDPVSRAVLYGKIISALQNDPPWLTLYTPIKTIGLVGIHPHFEMPSDAVLDVAALPRI